MISLDSPFAMMHAAELQKRWDRLWRILWHREPCPYCWKRPGAAHAPDCGWIEKVVNEPARRAWAQEQERRLHLLEMRDADRERDREG